MQPSTLVRFAQQFGFEGFSDLQSVFRERLRERTSAYEERLRALREGGRARGRKSPSSTASSAPRRVDRQLAETHRPERLRARVDILAKAETIYLIARRRSYPMTSYMAYGFAKLEIRTTSSTRRPAIDDGILRSPRRRMRPSRSASPLSAETARLARGVRGARRTGRRDHRLVSAARRVRHEWLEVAEADHAGFRSLSATMALAWR